MACLKARWAQLLCVGLGAVGASACSEDQQLFVTTPWSEGLTQLLVVTNADDSPRPGELQLLGPGAPIALKVRAEETVKLHVWLLPESLDGVVLEGCGVTLGGEGEAVPGKAVLEAYVAGPLEFESTERIDFEAIPLADRPPFDLHFARCAPSKEQCRRSQVTRTQSRGFPDFDFRGLAAVDDDVAFLALGPPSGLLGFHLFRFAQGEFTPLETGGLGSKVRNLCFDGERVWGGSLENVRFGYALDGTLTTTAAGDERRPLLACGDGQVLEYGPGGLRGWRGPEVPPLDENVLDVVLLPDRQAWALTSSAIFHLEDATWRTEATFRARERWTGLGGNADQLLSVSVQGGILERRGPHAWENAGKPWSDRQLYDVGSVAGGRALISGQDGLMALRREAVICEVDPVTNSNLEVLSASPSGRVVWIGADDNNSVEGDDPVLVRVEVPE